MIISRPEKNEPDLLVGHESKDLYLYDLEGNLVVRQNPPMDGWTHDSIEAVSEEIVSSDTHPLKGSEENPLKYGWDAYLGDRSLDNWIGSSEV